MRRSGFWMTGLFLAGIIVTSACAGGSTASTSAAPAALAADAASGAQSVTVTVGNAMSFDPASITVHTGQPVQLTLRNTGVLDHDFALSVGVAQPMKIIANGG